jgi:hypothetical protein
VPQKPPAAPIAKENPVWVILTKTDLSDKRTNEFQGIWQPSESDIPHILQEARAHLEKLKKTSSEYERGRIATILSGWDKSACQVVGHVKDGKKLVHLNFFPKDFPKDDEDCSGWQHRYIVVFDGGADFWQIDYDNEAKVFLDFWSNGDA